MKAIAAESKAGYQDSEETIKKCHLELAYWKDKLALAEIDKRTHANSFFVANNI